ANIAAGFLDARVFSPAESVLDRAVPLAESLPEPVRSSSLYHVQMVRGDLFLARAQQEPKSGQRAADIDKAIAVYQAANKAAPEQLIAANNLAWLLSEERHDAQAAYEVLQKARVRRPGQKPLSGDRLDLEVLDTFGLVLLASGHHAEATQLFH